jgi:uncharacterized protein YtpQ (UPF0354 family)
MKTTIKDKLKDGETIIGRPIDFDTDEETLTLALDDDDKEGVIIPMTKGIATWIQKNDAEDSVIEIQRKDGNFILSELDDFPEKKG